MQISADIQQFPQLNQLKDSSCEKFQSFRTYCTVRVKQISQSWFMIGKTKHNFWEGANISSESHFESSVSSHWSQSQVNVLLSVFYLWQASSPQIFWLESSPQAVWTKVPPADWLTGWCRAFFCSCTLNSLYHNRFMASVQIWWMDTKQKQGHFPHFVKPDTRTYRCNLRQLHAYTHQQCSLTTAGLRRRLIDKNKKCVNSQTGLESIPRSSEGDQRAEFSSRANVCGEEI